MGWLCCVCGIEIGKLEGDSKMPYCRSCFKGGEMTEVFMPKDHMEELYNSKNLLVKWFFNKKLSVITKAVPQGKLKVLDAGCGEGHLLKHLHEQDSGLELYGVDITPVALEKAREKCPMVRIRYGDVTNLPYEDSEFDVVICTDVLEHIVNYQGALRELQRVLKKDGTLIITFPNEFTTTIARFFLGRRPVKVPDHVNSLKPGMIKENVTLPCDKTCNLPFNLPRTLSLATMMVFTKK